MTTLVAVCGLPGAGKTTVAEWIADRRDARLLRTDVVRRDVVSDPEYTDAERRRVYEAVFDRAEAALRDRENVVIDATFDSREYRERARDLAAATGAGFELVRVECDPAVAKRRIRRREGDESEATVENYYEIREGFDPVRLDHTRIDNSGDLSETRRRLREHFAAIEAVERDRGRPYGENW